MLASDLNNPQFANPINPDEVLHVEFYWHEPIMQRQSIEQQKVIKGKKMPYVRIMRPGDQTSIIETAVRDDIKARFPQKWLAWQMKEGMIEVYLTWNTPPVCPIRIIMRPCPLLQD